MQNEIDPIEFVLPDHQDIPDVVADYLDLIAPEQNSSDERGSLIANCEKSFSLIIRAWEIAQAHGIVEQRIFRTFMRDIAMSGEASLR